MARADFGNLRGAIERRDCGNRCLHPNVCYFRIERGMWTLCEQPAVSNIREGLTAGLDIREILGEIFGEGVYMTETRLEGMLWWDNRKDVAAGIIAAIEYYENKYQRTATFVAVNENVEEFELDAAIELFRRKNLLQNHYLIGSKVEAVEL